MTVKLICVGRLKEKFYGDACAEFKKRISRFADVNIIEVSDERAPEQLSPAEMEQVKRAEGERILAKVAPGDYLIAMDLKGEQLTSPEMASRLQGIMNSGGSRIDFVIGGSLGLSYEVLQRADLRLCFGKPTFSHQIFRIMLLEQIYRCFKIINNEPYHSRVFMPSFLSLFRRKENRKEAKEREKPTLLL